MKAKMRDKFNSAENVKLRCMLLLVGLVLCLGADSPSLSVTLLSPANGSVISGIITFTGVATSSSGPVQRVEIWDQTDNKIVAIWSNTAATPSGLKVTSKSN